MNQSVLWLKHVDKDDLRNAGRKGVELGDMAHAGIPIPDGFVITSNAYFQFLESNKLIHRIQDLLATIHFEYPESVMQVSHHIKHIIMQGHISDEMKQTITAAYTKLSQTTHGPVVFLHTSPTTQTLPVPSFLGQHELHLYVHGIDNLLVKTKEAFASVFDAGAMYYRNRHHFEHLQAGIAIVVQKMVQTDVSGIILTDSTTGNIVIQTKLGGQTSHHYELHKTKLSLDKTVSAEQTHLLKETQLIELAQLGKKLEQHYYFPQYVEWALDHHTLYILHSRQLTEHDSVKKLPILKGTTVIPGIVTGYSKKIVHERDFASISNHDIIVIKELSIQDISKLKKARGIIIQTGEKDKLSTHMHELGVPVIIDVKHVDKLKQGSLITLNATKGEVYKA